MGRLWSYGVWGWVRVRYGGRWGVRPPLQSGGGTPSSHPNSVVAKMNHGQAQSTEPTNPQIDPKCHPWHFLGKDLPKLPKKLAESARGKILTSLGGHPPAWVSKDLPGGLDPPVVGRAWSENEH